MGKGQDNLGRATRVESVADARHDQPNDESRGIDQSRRTSLSVKRARALVPALSVAEVIAVLRDEARVLRESWTHRVGPNTGEVMEPSVVYRIRCLERAIEIVRGL